MGLDPARSRRAPSHEHWFAGICVVDPPGADLHQRLAKTSGPPLESLASPGLFCGSAQYSALLLAGTRHQGLGFHLFGICFNSLYDSISSHSAGSCSQATAYSSQKERRRANRGFIVNQAGYFSTLLLSPLT